MANPSSDSKLRLGVKLGYGAGGFGVQCLNGAVVSFLLYYYTDIIVLAPLLVGIALALPRFWDAISDPLVGLISDRTQTRFGRRRPFILWGAPFLTLSFILLWYPFAVNGSAVVFTYLLLANLLFTTAITIVGVPYASLGGELSPHYHERTTVFAYSLAFGLIGGLVGAGMKFLADAMPFESKQIGYVATAACLAMPSMLLFFWTYLSTRETTRPEEVPKGKSFVRSLVSCFKNRSFRNLSITLLVANSGISLGIQFLPFMLKYWVGREELIFPAYAAYTCAVYVGFPVWKKIGERFDKKHVLTGAFVCAGLFYGLSFLMLRPGGTILLFIWAVLLGFCGAGGLLFPLSMIADIADEAELQTGDRSEGVFYGINSFINKLSLAIGSVVAALALSLAGFRGGEAQTESAIVMFRITYVFPVITYFISAFIIYRGYTLTEEEAHLNKLALRDIREGGAGSE